MSTAQASPLFELFVVYKDPSDYPGRYVLRRHCVLSGGRIEIDLEPLCVSRKLADIRNAVPAGLHRMPRWPDDDAVILELWL